MNENHDSELGEDLTDASEEIIDSTNDNGTENESPQESSSSASEQEYEYVPDTTSHENLEAQDAEEESQEDWEEESADEPESEEDEQYEEGEEEYEEGEEEYDEDAEAYDEDEEEEESLGNGEDTEGKSSEEESEEDEEYEEGDEEYDDDEEAYDEGEDEEESLGNGEDTEGESSEEESQDEAASEEDEEEQDEEASQDDQKEFEDDSPEQAKEESSAEIVSDEALPSSELTSASESSSIPFKDGQLPSEELQIELSHIEVNESSLPCGMLIDAGEGRVLIDAMAGRCCSMGFNPNGIGEATQTVAEHAMVDSAKWLGKDQKDVQQDFMAKGLPSYIQSTSDRIQRALEKPPGIPSELIQIWPSADAAIDIAISMARGLNGDSCYRTIAMVGSDHGRTGMCRSASGIPELQEGFGPMMAGFTHVPMGDDKAFAAAIDEQTACVLISPVNLDDAAIPCNADYLLKVRRICDQQQIALIIDETQLVFGSTGRPSTFQMLAEIKADLVIFSAGLFPGISGGLLLGNSKYAESYLNNLQDYPLHASILSNTLENILDANAMVPSPDDIHPIAIKIAEAISGFEFIRDINVTGLTIGIESDIDSSQIAAMAKRHGLIIKTAGPTAVCLQPPLLFDKKEEEALIERIGYTMETLERQFSDPSL